MNTIMKKMNSKMMSLAAGILMICLLPLATNAQEWRSTSTMPASGSEYSSQITSVGASDVYDNTSNTSDGSETTGIYGPRKIGNTPGDPGGQSEEFPIGDAALPLLLFAAAFAATVAIRNRRRQVAE